MKKRTPRVVNHPDRCELIDDDLFEIRQGLAYIKDRVAAREAALDRSRIALRYISDQCKEIHKAFEDMIADSLPFDGADNAG